MVGKEKLESYISMKEEIKELQYKMAHINDDDNLVGNSVINDYRSGYPVPQTVVGVDRGKYWKLMDRYRQRIAKLQKDCEEVEEFVESIEDSMTRRICRMIYLEGKSQKEAGKAVHMDRSRISRKLKQICSEKV